MVSKMASEKGAIIVSMGDIIREKAKKRGESSKETAQNLRAEHGDYIVSELTIKKLKNSEKKVLKPLSSLKVLEAHLK
nr:hypothetical protein [Methanobrevibacter oralis]